jgi:hypothetical protein
MDCPIGFGSPLKKLLKMPGTQPKLEKLSAFLEGSIK